jgi:hypothetical protein
MTDIKKGVKVFPIKSFIDIKTDYADTNAKVFYNQYTTILQHMLGLTNKQALVFAEILYQNYLFLDKVQDKSLRWDAVFSKGNRVVMMGNVGMHTPAFGNNITDLRKKGLLLGIRIPDNLIVYPENNRFQLVFNFKIGEPKSE